MATNGNNKRINLLPGDISRRREIIKRAVADSTPEYTTPTVAAGKTNGDLLRPKATPKKSFFSRLFGRKKPASPQTVSVQKPAKAPKDLPAGTPAPSALFKNVKPAAALPKKIQESPQEPEQKKQKISLFKRLFFKPASPVRGTDFLKPQAAAPAPTPKPKPAVPPPAPTRSEPKPAPISVAPIPAPKSAPAVAVPAPEPVLAVPEPPPPPPPQKQKQPEPAPAVPKPAVPKKEEPAPIPSEPKEPELTVAKPLQESALDVNLLSTEYQKAFVPSRGKKALAWSIGGTVALILLAYAGAYAYQIQNERAIASAVASSAELEQAAAEFADLAAEDTELAKKTAALGKLFEGHISFTAFLQSLESATIPEVTYTAIAVSRQGLVSITAEAPSYTALARQLTVYEEETPWIISANMSSASLIRDELGAETGVGFDITLEVDPAIFKQAL